MFKQSILVLSLLFGISLAQINWNGVVQNKDKPDLGPDLIVIKDLVWSTEFKSDSDLNEWNQETGG